MTRYNPDVPGRSTPATCRRKEGGKECGREAPHTISGSIELMGKLVNIKIPVCQDHIDEIQDGLTVDYSLGEEK